MSDAALRLRNLWTLLLLASAAGALGQPPDATVILEAGELQELLTKRGIETCSRLGEKERVVCLANLSLEAKSPGPCEADTSGECSRMASRVAMSGCGVGLSEEDRAVCELDVATRWAEPDACELATTGPACLSIVAVELEDPSIITGRIADAETRQQMLGFYSLGTGDVTVLDGIEDNYVADSLHMASAVASAARTGEPLDPGFCWAGLRGDYQERDGYVEDFDETQTECALAVRWINDLNATLATAETPAAAEATRRSLQSMLERLEQGDLEIVRVDDDERRRLAGLPPILEEADEVDGLRAAAEQARARCDYVGSLEAANDLREAVTRWNGALESSGQAGPAPQREAWLDAHYGDVATKAARQREFRTLLEAARDLYDQAVEAPTPHGLDAAGSLAELARSRAPHDPGCSDASEADVLLAMIADTRAFLAEQSAEEATPTENEEAADAERGSQLDGSDGWHAGVLEGSSDWQPGTHEDDTLAVESACHGPRPEFDAALGRLRAAFARQESEAVVAELSTGALAPVCDGDRERLEALRTIGVQLAQADAGAKASRMASAVGSAQEAGARRAQMWADAAAGLERILDEYGRARTAASSDPLFAGNAGAGPDGANDTSGSPGSASSPAPGSTRAQTPSCLVDPSVARSSSSRAPLWIQESGAALGLRGFKLMQLAARPAGGGTFHGPFPDETTARNALDRLCPPSQRATGSTRLQ